MILQEKIRKKSEGFGQLAPVFIEGAEFALENQWISVEDDLPCNHEELIDGLVTHPLFVRDKNGEYDVTVMAAKFAKWDFIIRDITHWMPIPKLPEE